MKYIVTINNKKYEVEVERGKANLISTTELPPQTVQPAAAAAPAQPVASPSSSPSAVQQNVSGQPVKAPMPGTILDIKVAQGTAVKRGDVLFILEAMKMENEITAPADGVVAQISISKGSSVNTGDLLAVLQ